LILGFQTGHARECEFDGRCIYGDTNIFLQQLPDNHIIITAAADSTINTLSQPPPPNASSTSVFPETANLPFIVDVHDDPHMSSPTTPDAADDFL